MLFTKTFLVSADHEKEMKEAQAKLLKLLKENEQVSSELNNTEKTFADFLKRLNKYKDTIEGYKKVGLHESCMCLSYFVIWAEIWTVNSFPPEWGDSEGLCRGLPGKDQKGGAALPDPQSLRRGENRTVRVAQHLSSFCLAGNLQWLDCDFLLTSSVPMKKLLRWDPSTRLRWLHFTSSFAGSSWRCSHWRRPWTRRWETWIKCIF